MVERRHVIDTVHLSRDWVEGTLFPACERLREGGGDVDRQPMRGRALYCLFYEPSFMTRASFERAAHLLGGQAYHTEDASRFFPAHSARFVKDAQFPRKPISLLTPISSLFPSPLSSKIGYAPSRRVQFSAVGGLGMDTHSGRGSVLEWSSGDT